MSDLSTLFATRVLAEDDFLAEFKAEARAPAPMEPYAQMYRIERSALAERRGLKLRLHVMRVVSSTEHTYLLTCKRMHKHAKNRFAAPTIREALQDFKIRQKYRHHMESSRERATKAVLNHIERMLGEVDNK